MQRRSNAVRGWVNFPVDHPDYPSTGEGGMVVKLVVYEPLDRAEEWAVCCGANVSEVRTEELVGDDRRPLPVQVDESPEGYRAHSAAVREWEEYHYPRTHPEEDLSIPYLASLVLGTTGWSGYNRTEHTYWHCTKEDLTDAGRALYESMEQLYPGCDIHLLTFLDT